MTDPKWYCWKGDTELGPFSEDQLRQLIRTGMIQPADRIRAEGSTEWIEAATFSAADEEPAANAVADIPDEPVAAPASDQTPAATLDEARVGRPPWHRRWLDRYRRSKWAPETIVTAVIVVVFLIWQLRDVIPLWMARDPAPNSKPTRYETRRWNGTVFYWSKDLKEESERLASALIDLEYVREKNKVEVELHAEGERRGVKMFLPTPGMPKATTLSSFEFSGRYIAATAFPGKPMTLRLSDSAGTIVGTFEYPPSARTEVVPRFYVCHPVEFQAEAQAVAKYFDRPKPADFVRFITLDRKLGVWSLGLGEVSTADPKGPKPGDLRDEAVKFSKEVFGNAKVEVWLISEKGILRSDSGP